jgi:hypothetical protein
MPTSKPRGQVTDSDVQAALRKAKRMVPKLGVNLEQLLMQNQAYFGDIPIELLLAFIHYEAENNLWNNQTAGYSHKKTGKYIPQPKYYELGLFQTPAGLHGCVPSGPEGKQKMCRFPPPGHNVQNSPFGQGWFRLTGSYPTEINGTNPWNNPTIQVRVGLSSLNSTGERIRNLFPRLFTSKRSEWYLRMAVLYSFAQGSGWTIAYLQRYYDELLALPDNQRWGFLRDKPATLKGYDPKTELDPSQNVDRKMTLAAKLRAVRGVTN